MQSSVKVRRSYRPPPNILTSEAPIALEGLMDVSKKPKPVDGTRSNGPTDYEDRLKRYVETLKKMD